MRKFSLYFACFFTLISMGCGDPSADQTAQITTLKAEPAVVSPGGSTVITATVVGKKTGATGTEPAWGENVTFKLLTANGGQLSTLTQKADSKGEAKTVYTAGNNYNNDTIQATLDNGMSAALVIAKTGTPLSITVAASPASVSAGQVSIVTATLTGDGNAGVTVTFTLPVNNSGATLSASSAVTDGSGNAVVTYQPGTTSPALDVSDTVQASVGSISSTVAITRTGTAPLAYTLTITAVPATLATNDSNSVITATLKDITGTAVSGQSIAFTWTNGTLPGGTPITTDGNGNAVTTYKGPGVAGPGTGIVTASWNTYSNSVIINIP